MERHPPGFIDQGISMHPACMKFEDGKRPHKFECKTKPNEFMNIGKV